MSATKKQQQVQQNRVILSRSRSRMPVSPSDYRHKEGFAGDGIVKCYFIGTGIGSGRENGQG